MATPQTENTLRLERTLQAPREKIFAAWTRPEEVTRWFAPNPDYTVKVPALDVRPGGEYSIEMHHKDGSVHVAKGRYQEVTPPSRLVFTWNWEEHAWGETLVTVELFEQGDATRLVLTHERFADAAVRDDHERGWAGCIAQLERAL